MTNQTGKIAASALTITLLLNAGITTVGAEESDPSAKYNPNEISVRSLAPQDVIVVYKNNKGKKSVIDDSIEIDHQFESVPAVSATVTNDDLKKLINDPNIAYIEKNVTFEVDGNGEFEIASVPAEESQWNFQAVHPTEMWSQGYTGAGVKVALIDSGVMTTHPELKIAGGVSTVDYTTSYEDDNGHGTHVAGIVAAKRGNGGLVGIAPDTQLYAVKSMGSDGKGTLADLLEGIEWSIQNGMDIINISIGTEYDSEVLHDMIDLAYDSGILITSSAGNDADKSPDPSNSIDYPAKYSNVIAVSAVDVNMQRGDFSAMGPENGFAAPGVAITSTWFNGKYAKTNGTSQAAPHIAAILAILKQKNPAMSNDQLRQELKRYAKDLGDPGFDIEYGNGFVTFTQENDIDAPAEVTNLEVTEVTDSSIEVTFTNPSDADFANANIYANGAKVGTVTDGKLRVNNLVASTAYTIAVKTVDTTGNESVGVSINAKTGTDGTPPAEVTSLTVTEKTTTTAKATWTNPVDADFAKVNLYVNDTLVGNVTGTEYEFTGLSASTKYVLTAKTVDTSGNESNGQTVNVTTEAERDTTAPAEVTSLTVTEKTTTTATATWTNPVDADFAKVNLYVNGTLVGNVTGTEYKFTGLTASTNYVLTAKTVDTTGNESNGQTVNVTTEAERDTTPPAEVTNLTVTEKTTTTAKVTWTNPVDTDFAKVNLYVNGTLVGETTKAEYQFSGLTPSTTYLLEAKTVDTTGNESNGKTVNVTTEAERDTTAPAEVTSLTVTEKTTTTAKVTWTNPVDTDFAKVNLYVNGTLVGNVTGTEYKFTGLTASTNYVLTAKTVDATGNESNGQTVNVTTEAERDTTAPAEVTSLTVTEKTTTTVKATWKNPSDADFAKVNLYVNGTLVGNVTGTEYEFTGLTASTNYVLTAKTVDTSGNESIGQKVNVTTAEEVVVPPVDTTAPGEVTSLTVTEKTTTTVKATWTNPTDADFAKVNLYVNGTLVGETTKAEYQFSGLTPSTTYLLEAKTVDTTGNESIGQKVSVTTSKEVVVPPVDTTPPAEVTILTVTEKTTTTVKATWTNPADADFAKVNLYLNGTLVGETIKAEYQFSGLTPSTTYLLEAKTVDTTGNESIGQKVNVTTAEEVVVPPVDTTAPAEVSNLYMSSVTTNSVTINWTNPSDLDFSNVNVYMDGSFVGKSIGNEYKVSGLTDSRSYSFVFKTIDQIGNESVGKTIVVKTNSLTPTDPNPTNPTNPVDPSVDMTAPGEVNSLNVSGYSETNLRIQWFNPNDSDFTKARIYVNNTFMGETSGDHYELFGLTPETTYVIIVKTIDRNGNESAGVAIVGKTAEIISVTPPVVTPPYGGGGMVTTPVFDTRIEKAKVVLDNAIQTRKVIDFVAATAAINILPESLEKKALQADLNKMSKEFDIKELPKKTNVSASANVNVSVTTVSLSGRYKYIDSSSITSENVFVINSKGDVMRNIEVTVSGDNIFIKSKDGKFVSYETYTIYIDKSVKTKMSSKIPFGRSLKNSLMMQFTTN